MKKFLLLVIVFFGHTVAIKAQDKPKWKAPENTKLLVNPVEEQDYDSSIEEAYYVFSRHCVACHGKLGKGDGMKAKKFNPPPANLTSQRVQDQKDGEIFWKISHGRNRMLSFKKIINEEDKWFLVNYIRSLVK